MTTLKTINDTFNSIFKCYVKVTAVDKDVYCIDGAIYIRQAWLKRKIKTIRGTKEKESLGWLVEIDGYETEEFLSEAEAVIHAVEVFAKDQAKHWVYAIGMSEAMMAEEA